MSDMNVLQDFDNFFFYGQNDLQQENESDLLAGCVQPARSLYYNRQDAAGINEKENHPDAISTQFLTRFNIVSWVAYRNGQVSDGQNNTLDRRLAVSQNSVNIKTDGKGNLSVSILYIPFSDFKTPQNLKIPAGGMV
jgi:hypothetical protein